MATTYLIDVQVNQDPVNNILLGEIEFIQDLSLSLSVFLKIDDGSESDRCLSAIKGVYAKNLKASLHYFHEERAESREICPFIDNVIDDIGGGIIITDENGVDCAISLKNIPQKRPFINYCVYDRQEYSESRNEFEHIYIARVFIVPTAKSQILSHYFAHWIPLFALKSTDGEDIGGNMNIDAIEWNDFDRVVFNYCDTIDRAFYINTGRSGVILLRICYTLCCYILKHVRDTFNHKLNINDNKKSKSIIDLAKLVCEHIFYRWWSWTDIDKCNQGRRMTRTLQDEFEYKAQVLDEYLQLKKLKQSTEFFTHWQQLHVYTPQILSYHIVGGDYQRCKKSYHHENHHYNQNFTKLSYFDLVLHLLAHKRFGEATSLLKSILQIFFEPNVDRSVNDLHQEHTFTLMFQMFAGFVLFCNNLSINGVEQIRFIMNNINYNCIDHDQEGKELTSKFVWIQNILFKMFQVKTVRIKNYRINPQKRDLDKKKILKFIQSLSINYNLCKQELVKVCNKNNMKLMILWQQLSEYMIWIEFLMGSFSFPTSHKAQILWSNGINKIKNKIGQQRYYQYFNAHNVVISGQKRMIQRFQLFYKHCSLFSQNNHSNTINNQFELFATNLGLTVNTPSIGRKSIEYRQNRKFMTQLKNVACQKRCDTCGRRSRKLKICKRCKSKYFCSKMCQKYDWKHNVIHRSTCCRM